MHCTVLFGFGKHIVDFYLRKRMGSYSQLYIDACEIQIGEDQEKHNDLIRKIEDGTIAKGTKTAGNRVAPAPAGPASKYA